MFGVEAFTVLGAEGFTVFGVEAFTRSFCPCVLSAFWIVLSMCPHNK